MQPEVNRVDVDGNSKSIQDKSIGDDSFDSQNMSAASYIYGTEDYSDSALSHSNSLTSLLAASEEEGDS